MQVLCKASNIANDLRCPICGKGFLLYWTRRAPDERHRWREQIVKTLRGHHGDDQSAAAHPQAAFMLAGQGTDFELSTAA